jgi:3-hydroxyisobutyrate dehydrogenase
MKIGWIGTGVMGSSMAGHLLNAGNEMFVYNRTASKAETLVSQGAIYCQTIAELVSQVEMVFTIIGTPEDVRNVYL